MFFGEFLYIRNKSKERSEGTEGRFFGQSKGLESKRKRGE